LVRRIVLIIPFFILLFILFGWMLSNANPFALVASKNNPQIPNGLHHALYVEPVVHYNEVNRPLSKISYDVDEYVEGVIPVNMNIEVTHDHIQKVILGKKETDPDSYVFAVFDNMLAEDDPPYKLIELPDVVGDVRIVGVSRGVDFYLGAKEGNELVYRLVYSDEPYVILINKCKKRC
jgi:hypothetical protein